MDSQTSAHEVSEEDVFYAQGLRFTCVRCSRCCRHEPGFVFLSEQDLRRLARATHLARETCVQEYCREVEIGGVKRLSLKEKPNYDCIFWVEAGCEVYAHRPIQCRSFPFWSSNLISRATWEEVGQMCPGTDKGALHSRDEIDDWLQQRETEGFARRASEDDEE